MCPGYNPPAIPAAPASGAVPPPVYAPLMMMPHVPAAPPVPYFPVPNGAGVPAMTPPMPVVPDHQTQAWPPYYGYGPHAMVMPPPMPVAMGKAYAVQVKLIEAQAGKVKTSDIEGKDKCVTEMPTLSVVEGVPGICRTGVKGAVAVLRVRVQPAAPGQAELALCLSKRTSREESDGSISVTKSCRVVRAVKIDAPVRVPLCKGCKETSGGKEGKWLEIQVKEVAAKEAKPSVNAAYGRDAGNLMFMVQPRIIINEEEEARAIQEQNQGPEAECTLPSPYYAEHPPQYVPQSPPYPLPPEVVGQAPIMTTPPVGQAPVSTVSVGQAPVMTIPVGQAAVPVPVDPLTVDSIVRCVATEKKCDPPGVVSSVRVVNVTSDGSLQVKCDDCTVHGTSAKLTVKGTSLVLRPEEIKGHRQVSIEADCDLDAHADTLTIESDGRIVLEGDVKILCASPTSGTAERVEADRVILVLETGKMKSIQVAPQK
jgi:hypothetical protein